MGLLDQSVHQKEKINFFLLNQVTCTQMARKLQLIEAVLKTENEEILKTLENVVANSGTNGQLIEGKFSVALGLLTNEEAEAMKHTIGEAFEKINPDD